MRLTAIRTALARRPFRPLEFLLDDGETIRIGSPEILLGTDGIVTLDPHGRIVVISPEAVSVIRPATNGSRGR